MVSLTHFKLLKMINLIIDIKYLFFKHLIKNLYYKNFYSIIIDDYFNNILN